MLLYVCVRLCSIFESNSLRPKRNQQCHNILAHFLENGYIVNGHAIWVVKNDDIDPRVLQKIHEHRDCKAEGQKTVDGELVPGQEEEGGGEGEQEEEEEMRRTD